MMDNKAWLLLSLHIFESFLTGQFFHFYHVYWLKTKTTGFGFYPQPCLIFLSYRLLTN